MMNIITSVISTIVVLIMTWFTLRVIVDFYQDEARHAHCAGAPQVDSPDPHFRGQLSARNSIYTENIRLHRQMENTDGNKTITCCCSKGKDS